MGKEKGGKGKGNLLHLKFRASYGQIIRQCRVCDVMAVFISIEQLIVFVYQHTWEIPRYHR